jgi:hypothetical protein
VALFFHRLLFEKKAATVESDYNLDESVYRLSSIVHRWPYVSLHQGLIGQVRLDKIHISRFIPIPIFMHCKPELFGMFQLDSGKVVLRGHFAMGTFSRFLFSVYLCLAKGAFCLSIPLMIYLGFYPPASLAGMNTLSRIVNLMLIPLLFFGCVILVIAVVLWEKWLRRNDEAFIVMHIRHALQKEDCQQ